MCCGTSHRAAPMHPSHCPLHGHCAIWSMCTGAGGAAPAHQATRTSPLHHGTARPCLLDCPDTCHATMLRYLRLPPTAGPHDVSAMHGNNSSSTIHLALATVYSRHGLTPCRYDACDIQGLVRHYCTVNYCNFPFFEVRAAHCARWSGAVAMLQ